MNAGELRHSITIEQAVETQDGYGAPAVTWTPFAAQRRAKVEPLSGREYFAAQAMQATIDTKITLRYLAGVTPKMRVTYAGRVFDIDTPINVDERNRWLILMCTERV